MSKKRKPMGQGVLGTKRKKHETAVFPERDSQIAFRRC